jgi:hypothetical protein
MLRSGGHAPGSQGLREAKQVVVAGHPSDEENPKTSKFALEGLVSLVIKGSLVFWVPPYILFEGMDGRQLLDSSSFVFPFLFSFFPSFS